MKKENEQKVTLEALIREQKGTRAVRNLRKEAFVPAVVYGRGKETEAIKIKRTDLLKYFYEHGRENVIIALKIIKDSKLPKVRHVLIKDIQHDPLKGDPMHIDFHEISLTEVIHVRVPLAAIGEPVGVKQEGGMLEHHLWELNIECLPTDIPKQIEYDVTNLKMGGVVHIKELNIPSNLKVLHDQEMIVFSVVMPKEELPPEEAAAAAAPAEPEVIKEKKLEEGKEGKEQKEEKEEKRPKEEKKAKEEKKE